ncbi:type 4b pilus protein PilO2 [Comamonas composti]|uniref:type 4b pilus protein PilO2 n=1 Tax=Comamonas composti TaxID=408558 RepID=UPI0004255BA1|nr:type 4b pilus protein PilO2 [Comamonas composti]
MVALQIEDRWYALGLEWAFADDEQELRQTWRASAPLAVISLPSEDGLLYGVASSDTSDSAKSPIGLSAAALLVGQLLPDALVHHRLPNGSIWLCVVRDGLPLPGSDCVCSVEEAGAALEEIQAYQPDLPRIGSLPGSIQELPALLASAPAKVLRRTLLRRPPRPLLRRLLLLAIGCACLLSLLIWQHLGKRHQPAQQAASGPMPELMPDLAALRTQHQKQVDQALAKSRHELRQQVGFMPVANQWLQTVRQLPLSVGGYRPRQVDCSPESCLVEWDWSAETFEVSALSRLPGELQPAATPAEYATVARTRIALAPVSKQSYEPLTGHALDEALLKLRSSTHRYGGRADISRANQTISVSLPAPPAALEGNASAAPQSQVIGQRGQVRLMVAGWAQTQKVLQVMGQSSLLIPERAVIALNQSNVTLQVEARYITSQGH